VFPKGFFFRLAATVQGEAKPGKNWCIFEDVFLILLQNHSRTNSSLYPNISPPPEHKQPIVHADSSLNKSNSFTHRRPVSRIIN